MHGRFAVWGKKYNKIWNGSAYKYCRDLRDGCHCIRKTIARIASQTSNDPAFITKLTLSDFRVIL